MVSNSARRCLSALRRRREEAEVPPAEAAAVASREPEAPDPNNPALIVQALENRDLSVLDRAVGVLRNGAPDQQEAVASAIASLTPNSLDKDGSKKVAVARAGAI